MNLKSSKKGIEALVILLGILIVVVTYFFGFMKLQEKTRTLEFEKIPLKAKADAYEYLFNNAKEYQTQAATMKADKEALMNNFLYNINSTDRIIYTSTMEGKVGNLVINYLNMGDPTAEYFTASPETNPILVAGGITAPDVADDGVAMYTYPMDFGFEVTYDGFKQLVAYLNTIGGSKHIESLTLAFNSSTGILSGAMSVNQYVLSGTGKDYVPLEIPYVPTSLDNIFGTVNPPETEKTVSQELTPDATNVTGE